MQSFSSVSCFVLAALLLVSACVEASAQGPTRGRVEPPRDPVLEVNAKHNLQVAKWYITRRKAYRGGIDRLQEILDAYPGFSRLDEVLFFLGEAHLKLGEEKEAAGFYRRMLDDFPSSELAKKARETLERLKVPIDSDNGDRDPGE